MYSKETMKNRKNGYLEFALLASSMNAYEYNEGDEKDNLETIKSYCEEIVDDILLPSNRIGTPLAVALETHSFKSALYLIENAERFRISFKNLLRDDEYKPIDINEELEFVLSYFSISEEKKRIEMYSHLSDREMEELERKHLKEELEALDKIKRLLKEKDIDKKENTSLKF